MSPGKRSFRLCPKYPAPNIRTDSSSDDKQLLPTKHKCAKKTLEPEPEPEQDDENESNTSEYEDELDAKAEIEGEHEDDAQASNYIQAEYIWMLNNHTHTANSTSCSGSGRSTQSFLPTPPGELGENKPTLKKATCHQAQKLQSELPQVCAHPLPITHTAATTAVNQLPQVHSRPLPITNTAAPTAVTQVHSRSLSITHAANPTTVSQLDTAPAAPAWLECTNIHIIKKLVHACLMEMAERSGHDGNNDVCDRLERGDHDSYRIPLVTYVSRRIGNKRADLKAHSSTILQAFGLVNHAGCLEAGALARRCTYYYPKMSNEMPDYRKPFEHPVFASFLREAFFSSTYYSSIVRRNFHLFKSSNSEKSEELEVTKGMVALAAAAIHACLHDYSTGMKSSFPAPKLDGVWGLAIDILEGIECGNHLKYHRLMHKIFVEAIGNSMTARDAIENSNGDDEAHVYPNPVGDCEDVASVHSGNSHHTEASTTPALATISTPSD
ncbi:hypothetical protein F5877DRAFT_70099 [Lentinula edodes]|nr:hypothetical protein F5877DRAFT_70099 [Lentinula edodes]